MFQKEVGTLYARGFNIRLISQHDRPEVVKGIRIIPLPKARSRFDRMTRLVVRLIWLATKQRTDVYHLHDPALIPVGVVLELLGKKVLYDAHEAHGEKILSKEWIKPSLRRIVSVVFS